MKTWTCFDVLKHFFYQKFLECNKFRNEQNNYVKFVNDLILGLFIVGKYAYEYAQRKHTIKMFKCV